MWRNLSWSVSNYFKQHNVYHINKETPPIERGQGGITLHTWKIFFLFDEFVPLGRETGHKNPSIAATKNNWSVASTHTFMMRTGARLPLPLFCVFRARKVYVSGLLLDSLGMLLMALTRHRYAVIVFSAAAGVMYSTLFTVPYLLVAHYHASGTVRHGLEW